MNREFLLERLKNIAQLSLDKEPANRTYADRYFIWEFEQVRDNLPYNEGEEVEIYDGNALANNKIKDGFGHDFPEWFRECGKHFGKHVKNITDGKVYTLIGMSYTYRDYYYILEDSSHNKHYLSCVGGIKFL